VIGLYQREFYTILERRWDARITRGVIAAQNKSNINSLVHYTRLLWRKIALFFLL
jgi:hypothetical protein